MNVLVYAHEVGSANAIAPVIRGLKDDASISVEVFASGKAHQKFRESTIDHKHFDLSSLGDLDSDARTMLHKFSPHVLLLGAAGDGFARSLVKAGIEIGVPSVTLLDMWSNYSERFTDLETGEVNLPTRIAVMDKLAHDESVNEGIPKDRLAITGQPHLEYLASCRFDQSLVDRAAILRKSWLIGSEAPKATKIVLFASEAFAKDFGPGTPQYRGYTEHEALEGVASAVKALCGNHSDCIMSIVVKLHPEEDIKTFRVGPSAWEVGISITANAPAWESVMAADIVVGMSSMLLMEAAILGRPTFSYQPGVSNCEDGFVGTRLGFVPAYSNCIQLGTALYECLIHKSAKQQKVIDQDVPEFMRPGAARRVIDLLQKECLSASRSKVGTN